jgi:hypothetical protein
MALNMLLGSLGFLWSGFLRGSYRWRPGITSDTTTHTCSAGGPSWEVQVSLLSIRMLMSLQASQGQRQEW